MCTVKFLVKLHALCVHCSHCDEPVAYQNTSLLLCLQAYVDLFTKSMEVELRTTGVTMQNMAPLFVATKMSKIRKPSLSAPSAAQWARAAIKHIGYETTSSPYWFHALQWYCVARVPSFFVHNYVLNLHKGFRNRWYKKQGKAQ